MDNQVPKEMREASVTRNFYNRLTKNVIRTPQGSGFARFVRTYEPLHKSIINRCSLYLHILRARLQRSMTDEPHSKNNNQYNFPASYGTGNFRVV